MFIQYSVYSNRTKRSTANTSRGKKNNACNTNDIVAESRYPIG